MNQPWLPILRKTTLVGYTLVKEYIIPEKKGQEVLIALYPFAPVSSIAEEMYALREGKRFYLRDLKVVRKHGVHVLVRPYYSNGGSVIKRVPPECRD